MCLVGGAGRKARTVTHYKQLPGNSGRPGLPSPIRKFGARGNGASWKGEVALLVQPGAWSTEPPAFPSGPEASLLPCGPASNQRRPWAGGWGVELNEGTLLTWGDSAVTSGADGKGVNAPPPAAGTLNLPVVFWGKWGVRRPRPRRSPSSRGHNSAHRPPPQSVASPRPRRVPGRGCLRGPAGAGQPESTPPASAARPVRVASGTAAPPGPRDSGRPLATPRPRPRGRISAGTPRPPSPSPRLPPANGWEPLPHPPP